VKFEPKTNTDQRVSSAEPYRFGNLYFEGRWQPSSAGYSAEVSSPWTLQTIARINVAKEADVDRSFEFAKQAQVA